MPAQHIYRYDVFAYNHDFHIYDIKHAKAGTNINTHAIWEKFYFGQKGIYFDAAGYMLVSTKRNMDSPVTVEIWNTQPDQDYLAQLLEVSDHAAISGFESFSGEIIVDGGLMSDEDLARRIPLAKGTYEIRMFANRLDKISWNGLEGEDTYHLIFFPNKIPATEVLKQYHDW
jgi:hypothetical protein